MDISRKRFLILSEINAFSSLSKFAPEKCSVYLRLPWIGNTSAHMIEQIKRSISRSFNAVNLRIFLNITSIFCLILKTVCPFIIKDSEFTNFNVNVTFVILDALLKYLRTK